MQRSYIIVLIFLFSCTFIDDPTYHVDPKLIPYIDSFFKEGLKRNCDCAPQSLRAEIYPLQGHANGKSYRIDFVNSIPHIVVDLNYFENSNSLGIESVVYHELGHALFNLSHSNDGGIMDSDTGEYQFSNYEKRQILLDNLFKKRCP